MKFGRMHRWWWLEVPALKRDKPHSTLTSRVSSDKCLSFPKAWSLPVETAS